MEMQQVIFYRNLFLRALVIGVIFTILYFLLTVSFWDTWVSLVQSWFKVDERDSARLVLSTFFLIRLILVFCMLVPALALHWTSKAK